MQVTCTRCGKAGEPIGYAGLVGVPEGWEGSIDDAVCPGCQVPEWHPLCQGLVDFDGERVDLNVIPREEIDWNRLSRCEHLDLTVVWVEGDEWPAGWCCPECGCTEFGLVHREYPPSGFRGRGSTSSSARSTRRTKPPRTLPVGLNRPDTPVDARRRGAPSRFSLPALVPLLVPISAALRPAARPGDRSRSGVRPRSTGAH
jgi:hypothetical protein